MNKALKLIISILTPLLVGFTSSFLTPQFNGWYSSLSKPPFTPPNWVFGPVWAVLYILVGFSFYLVWKDRDLKEFGGAAFIYFVHLGLNFLWSLLFFGFQNPDIAFIEIFLLLISVLFFTLEFYKLNKKTGYILVPYLLWVSFAAILNFSISILN